MNELVLTIDITLTGAMVGAVDNNGNLIFGQKVPFDLKKNQDVLPDLKKIALELLEKNQVSYDDVTKIAVDIPGFIDHTTGVLKAIPVINIHDWNLKAEIAKLFVGKSVYVLNDAFAAALGEFWVGTGVQYDSIVFYTIDSTIGGAIINQDKLIIGSRGFAGQFSHGLGLTDRSTQCPCGLKGCLTACCSEQGLKDFFIDALKNKNHPAAFYFDEINLDDLDSGVIYEIYKKNDEPREIYDLTKEALYPLLKHMVIMNSALNPDAIIFSGSVARMDDFLIKLIRDAIKELSLERFNDSNVVEQAILGPDAAMIGAAYYALNDGLVEE